MVMVITFITDNMVTIRIVLTVVVPVWLVSLLPLLLYAVVLASVAILLPSKRMKESLKQQWSKKSFMITMILIAHLISRL